MDKRYLEYILVLAETGNMTRAAQKLYISQPTLSQFLSKQEAAIGAPLFQRSKGIYTLTPAGELYAEYARKVLSLTDLLEKDIRRITNTSCIRIGTSASRSLQLLTSILVDFRRYYPRIELVLSDNNLYTISNSISKGELDIAFAAAYSLDQFKGHCIELKKEEIVFAAPSDHTFCKKLDPDAPRSLTSSELLRHFGTTPFILQLKGSCIRHLVNSFFEKQDFNPTIACNTSHAESIRDMVSNKLGVGFIAAGYASPSPNITYFSLSPKLYRIHTIIYRKDLILEAPHKCLLDLAKKHVEANWNNL